MNLKSLLALAALATVSVAAAQENAVDAPKAPPITLKVGDIAPPITVVKWVKGKPVTNVRDGGVHVVEFWATWCGPCKTSIPHLTELAAKYKGKADFTGVSVWEEESPKYLTGVSDFVKQMGSKMDYSVAADGQGDQAVMAKTWMMAAGQDGIPSAFVVGKDGRIAWIGHPMDGLDEVVGKVVDGTFDVKGEIERQETMRSQMDEQRELMQKQQALMEPFIKAMSANDLEGALLELDSIFEAEPSLKYSPLATEKIKLLLETDEPKAYEYGRTLLSEPEKYDPVLVYNNSAWEIVKPDTKAKKADLKLALELAKLAVKGTDDKDAFSIDTLAYVYFKMDDLDKAIELQEKAVALAKKSANVPPDTLKEMSERLDGFKKTKAEKK